MERAPTEAGALTRGRTKGVQPPEVLACVHVVWRRPSNGKNCALVTNIAASLIPHLPLYADAVVTTVTARFVHGAHALISERLAHGRSRDEAFIAREELADATGLAPSWVISYCERQQEELGLITITTRGSFGRIERPDGSLRGEANGYALAEVPDREVERIELATEPYRIDIDHEAVAPAMLPTDWRWAKNARAHRLAMALLFHAGLERVRLTTYDAAKVLGKSRVTAWRALKDLAALGLAAEDGTGWWVDLSPCFYAPEMSYPAPALEQRKKDHAHLHDAAFTKEGRELASAARIARDTVARLRGLGRAPTAFSTAIGRSIRQAVLWHLREAGENPGAWGSGLGPEDFKMLGWT